MKLTRKLLIYIGIGIMLMAVICIIGGIIYYRQDQAANNAFRCHFEELLKPGMTRAEVEQVLSQFGTYHLVDSDFGPDSRLGVSYIDSVTNKRFGGYFVIQFSNYTFFGIYRPHGSDGDDILPMCNE